MPVLPQGMRRRNITPALTTRCIGRGVRPFTNLKEKNMPRIRLTAALTLLALLTAVLLVGLIHPDLQQFTLQATRLLLACLVQLLRP